MRGPTIVFVGLGACSGHVPAPNECGPGPYVSARTGLVAYLTGEPIVGATAVLDACPEQRFTSNDAGYFELQMTKELPFDPRLEAEGFIPMRSGQSSLSADLDVAPSPMFPTGMSPLFPHLTKSSPAMAVLTGVAPGGATDGGDPCATKDGITFSVPGHSEAVVTYYAGSGIQPRLDTSLTASTGLGSAEIGGLAATNGPEIELSASKPGCTIAFVSYPHTGKYALENGVLTLTGAFMPPVAPP